MVTGINESKILTKYESCECKLNLIEKIVIQINGRIMINVTGINESKILTKHESCECKCKFNRINCNLDQW